VSPAYDGRFLASCKLMPALLDVRSQTIAMLPEPAPSGGSYIWYMVGSRYVLGVGFAYEIATGAVTTVGEAKDPDFPGASIAGLCPRLRSRIEAFVPPWVG
jgi:hypothetical protein